VNYFKLINAYQRNIAYLIIQKQTQLVNTL